MSETIVVADEPTPTCCTSDGDAADELKSLGLLNVASTVWSPTESVDVCAEA